VCTLTPTICSVFANDLVEKIKNIVAGIQAGNIENIRPMPLSVQFSILGKLKRGIHGEALLETRLIYSSVQIHWDLIFYLSYYHCLQK